MIVRLTPGASFRFPFADSYWSDLLLRSFRYEAELQGFFEEIRDVDYAFLDCGANFGYWSVLVSDRDLGSKPVLAIEAASINFEKLTANAKLNNGRFTAIHRAIGEASGQIVEIRGHKHEAFSSVGPTDAPVIDKVETLSLDDAGLFPQIVGPTKLVIKLDVEGVEKEAVRGGRTLLARDAILVAEDHGADRTHDISHFLKDQEGYRLFIARDGGYREITDIDATLGPYKRNRRVGYNVFATKSPFWIERLGSIQSKHLN